MVSAQIGENLLTLIILGGLGYIIYQRMQGKKVLEGVQERTRRIFGGKNG